MANVHNMVLRGLNSIHRQAPYIKPGDVQSFLRYSLCFYDLLHVHHEGEEDILFPWIQEATKEANIMDRNIDQHRAFHAGLEAFKNYIDSCLNGQQVYNGLSFLGIINSFGHVLASHLTEEIHTLLELSQYNDGRLDDFEKEFDAWAKQDVVSF